MNVHVGLPEGLTFVAFLLVTMFLLRAAAARTSETSVGKALGWIIG